MFIKILNLILNTDHIIEIDFNSGIKMQPYSYLSMENVAQVNKALESIPVVRIVTTQNEWQIGHGYTNTGEGQHTYHLFYGETAEKLRQRLPIALRKRESNFEDLDIKELFIPECFSKDWKPEPEAQPEPPPGYPD